MLTPWPDIQAAITTMIGIGVDAHLAETILQVIRASVLHTQQQAAMVSKIILLQQDWSSSTLQQVKESMQLQVIACRHAASVPPGSCAFAKLTNASRGLLSCSMHAHCCVGNPEAASACHPIHFRYC